MNISLLRSPMSMYMRRCFSTSGSGKNVAVLGAAGGIGQPLSLLLKDSAHIDSLRLFDIVNTPGVAADISHVDSKAKVSGFVGMESIKEALEGCDVAVIPAGVPRKPGMTRDDLFNTNASIVQNLAKSIGSVCPNAMILIISNPVNSTVPIVADTLKAMDVYNPKRLFGVTTLDVMRANTFVSELEGWDPKTKKPVKVVGGHAGTTILPLLSQIEGTSAAFSEEESLKKLMHRIQFGGDEVVQAKDGAGSATLSMAAAAARFTNRLLYAMDPSTKEDVVECAFVENNVTSCRFFSTEVTLGPSGVEKVHPIGSMSKLEQEGFESMLPDLEKQIKKGEEFVAKSA